MWSNVVEETGEPGENHRTWTGDHYPATCLDPDSNPDRRGDKRVRYPLRYPGPLSTLDGKSSKVNQVVFLLAPNSIPNMKALAQIFFEISCTHDFQILISKGHNSKKGHNSDMKNYGTTIIS